MWTILGWCLIPFAIVVILAVILRRRHNWAYHTHRTMFSRIISGIITTVVIIVLVVVWLFTRKNSTDEKKELAAKESAMVPNNVRPGVTDSVSTGYKPTTIKGELNNASDTITVYQRLGETMQIYLSANEMVDCLIDNNKTIHTFDGSAPYEDISSMEGHFKFRFFRHQNKNLKFCCIIQRY